MPNITLFDDPNAQNALQSLASMRFGGGSDLPFLKMLKGNGQWVYGVEEIEIPPESLWVINPDSIRIGYIAWHESQVEAEHMVPLGQPLPDASELPKVQAKKGWEPQMGLTLRSLDDGVEVDFQGSSQGAREAVVELARELVKADPKAPYPVVNLTSDYYKHKEWGRVYKPHFPVQSWMSDEDMAKRFPQSRQGGGQQQEPQRRQLV